MATVTINSFIEDTSVLVTSAFLFVRGPMERLLNSSAWVGVLAGGFAASEAAFPGDRYPYDPPVVACAFAVTFGGVRAGAITATMAVFAALALLPLRATNVIAVQVLVTLAVMVPLSRWLRSRWWSVGTSALAHACAIPLSKLATPAPPPLLVSPVSIPANAFGFVLLLLVVRDATLRAESFRHASEVLEAKRIAAEAQLAIVRTRVQPHFLFNALNSIAALCAISPKRASEATVNLGHLMRRALEIDLGKSIPLAEELAIVRSYLAVEQERFGPRLSVRYELGEIGDIEVPAFSVQILVENAVVHGVTPKVSGGQVCLILRRARSGATIYVVDDGVGIDHESELRASAHGLSILKQQLKAICGPAARLHVLQRRSGGTVAAFHVPLHRPKPSGDSE